MSNILRIDTITAGSILLTDNLVALKKGNADPILVLKRTGWRKFIDYFGLSIEADLYKVVKKNVHFSVLGIYQALHMEIPIYQFSI